MKIISFISTILISLGLISVTKHLIDNNNGKNEVCALSELQQFMKTKQNLKNINEIQQFIESHECGQLYDQYENRQNLGFPDVVDGIYDLSKAQQNITDVQFLDVVKISYITYLEQGPIKEYYIDMFYNEITTMEKEYEIIGEMYGIEVLSFNMGMNQIQSAKGIEYIQKLNLIELYVWTEHNSQTSTGPLYALLDFDSLEFLIVALDGNQIPEEESLIWKDAIVAKFPFAEKLIFI